MPDWPLHILQMLRVLLVIVGPVPLALISVRRWGADTHAPLENLLATIVLATSLELALGLTLGFTGLLEPVALLMAEAGLFAAGLLLSRRWAFARILPRRRLSTIEASGLLVVLVIGGLGAADLVVKPTQNFDSLAYHLPVMARWVSAGSLEIFAELGQVALYPSHYELLGTLLVLPVGQDLLVSLPNLLAWVQLGLALVLVARRLGARDEASVLAAALVLCTPSVLSRLDAVQPDIALAGTFLTALGFALRPAGPGRRLDVAVALLAGGILCGLKLSGPVYLLLLVPGLLLGPELRWKRPSILLRRLHPAASGVGTGFASAIALGAAAIGLAWYLRNWLVLGNPFGDLQIGIAGLRIFDGSVTGEVLRRGSLASTFVISSGADWAVLGQVLWSWFGGGVALLALGAGISPWARIDSGRRARLLTAVLLVLCVVLYWRTPYGGDNGTHGWRVTSWIEVGLRYGFPALGLLGALGAVGLSRSVWLVRLALVVLVVTAVRTMLDELILNALVLAIVVVAAWAASEVTRRGSTHARPIGVGVLALLAVTIAGLHFARTEREDLRRHHFGEIVEVLASELDDRDVVAVVNSQKLHLAAGMDWHRRVVVPALPATGAGAEWLARLRRQGVTALLVGHQEPDPDDAAAVESVQRFLRGSDEVELVADYESLAKDLAFFRIREPQSKR